ncbi:MAG: o-succinylbenzoate--CoA ligase [Bacteroidetes bacterium]|nr:o-succinylbenzoate--CoA ligase [Bacteroidota bacterium]MBU1115856.1 o-succinylbenzoate--CoA ligase [Bacteroidota bacterium]MBU1797970.1 o-succinylbenzoate--CoA ligase [Bacteroidota bacterium]
MIDNEIAIIDDTRSILFSELNSLVSKTAQHYFNCGIKPYDNVAILGNNSIEYVIAIYSLWKLGAVPVPINTRLKNNEVQSIVESSKCGIIIVDKYFSSINLNIALIEMTIKHDGDDCNYSNDIKPNDTAVIIHTSGSSGVPKGVETTNNNLYQSYLSSTDSFRFSNSDVFLASLPFYHIGGFSIISRAVLSGGVLVIPKSLQMDDIIKSMQSFDTTIVSLVPTMLKRMIEVGVKPNNHLRYLFLGGGASSDQLINSALNDNWPIVKVYGSSETTAMITAFWGEELRQNPPCAGKPLANIEIKILDDNFNEITNAAVGEIAIKSPTIAKGYLKLPNFWKDKTHNDLYLSGDYGYLDKDGKLFVVARRTDLIVSGGENIDPREIESALNTNPKIIESFVFPLHDEEWGEIPVAIIALSEKASLSKKEISEYLKSELASYKIPKIIVFTNEIPKTELGKVNIKEVKELFRAAD